MINTTDTTRFSKSCMLSIPEFSNLCIWQFSGLCCLLSVLGTRNHWQSSGLLGDSERGHHPLLTALTSARPRCPRCPWSQIRRHSAHKPAPTLPLSTQPDSITSRCLNNFANPQGNSIQFLDKPLCSASEVCNFLYERNYFFCWT